jgi:UDP-2-acetamido-2-deoxy-ribo-hexuluronate aminotransferase
LGATPVFVDIDKNTFNISADNLRNAIDALVKPNKKNHPIPGNGYNNKLTPKGIISVDIFGLPADYDKIAQIAIENDLFLIEDGAQSFGSEYKANKACSFGNIGCTSFFPAKPLGCYGDGGMCFTNDDSVEDKLRSILAHGKGEHKYDNARIGINGRLDTIQAAILHAKFDIFPEEVELRQSVAKRYISKFEKSENVRVQKIPDYCKSVWAQFSVLANSTEKRNELIDRLKAKNIPSVIYYPKPLHQQTAFMGLGYRDGDFQVSEEVSRRIFSLPMHPYLSAEEQDIIVNAIEIVS